MPTIEELEALREKPEQPTGPGVAAPASPPPELHALAALANPALDTTLDARPKANQSMDWAAQFEPGVHNNVSKKGPSDEEVDANVNDAFNFHDVFTDRKFTDAQVEEAWGKTIEQNKNEALASLGMVKEFGRGAANVAFDTLQAPGNLQQAVEHAITGVDIDLPTSFPGAAQLMGIKTITDKLQDEMNAGVDPNRSLMEKLPEAFGSAAAFMVGGLATGAETAIGQAITSGTLGAASSASSQYEEAKAYGADPEDALIAYAGGAVTGSSEGLPGFYFLKRLNQLGGGKVIEKLNALGMQGEHGLVREAVQGALTEMFQEGSQTIGSNWIAKDLAGYDPNRTMGENFWDSVITAGVVGSTLGGGLQMLREAELSSAKEQFEADFQKRMNSGDSINALGTPGNGFGSFTPVETLVQLNKLRADLDAHIDRKAQFALDRMAEASDNQSLDGNPIPIQFPTDAHEIPDDIIPQVNASPNLIMDKGEENFIRMAGGDGLVNASTESALKEKGKPLPTVREALARTDTVALPSRYEALVENLQKSKAALKARLEDALDKPASITREATESLFRQAKMIDLRLDQMTTKLRIANTLLGEVKNYTAAFRNVLNPNLKMVVRDSNLGKDRSAGWFSGSQNVLINGVKTPVGFMFVDMENLVDEVYKGGAKDSSLDYKKARRKLFEVINHELGHSILTAHFHSVLDKVTNGDPATARDAYKTFVLLQDDYREWLKEMSGSKWQTFMETSMPFQRADRMLQGAEEIGLPVDKMSTHETLPEAWPKKDYLLSFDEFFADQAARLATQGALRDPVLTKFFEPVLGEYQKAFEKYPQWAKNEYGNNWKQLLEQRSRTFKFKEELQKVQSGGGKDLWDAIRGKIEGMNPDNFAGVNHQIDHWSKGLSYGLNLLQMEKIFQHVPQFKAYRASVEAWAAYQRGFADKATETLENWRSLGKTDVTALAGVFYEESENRKNLLPQELAKRLNGEALIVYQQVREQLNRILDEMQATALRETNRDYSDNKEKLEASTKEIMLEFKNLKDSGYFPYVRFGDWTINARAKTDLKFLGKDFKAGELVTFQAFESKKDREEAYLKLRNELGTSAAVSAGKMRESEYTIQGMPRSLLLALRNRLQADGQLNDEVAKSIEQTLEANAPFKNFRNHFKKKQGIHGYSEDAFRTFAHYIRSAAGNISRVRYAGEMRESVDSMQGDVKTIQEVGGNATPRQEMVHWIRRHFDYIMNPASELAALRGVGFVAFLGFNIKSAFVNSMQVLSTTYPYLAARHGDLQAVSELGKAGAWLKKWTLQKKDFINAKPGSKESRIAELVARGHSEGWLDQSLATELAIAASESTLDRSLYLPSGKRFWHTFSRYSAKPFHIVEKTNRYITAFAAYNLEYNESGNHEKAILAAKLANQQTNFENARWNRPEFLRGKKSAALLFQNFVQNQLFFIAKDPGAVRYFCVMFILAGAMGLPGADDLVDVMDAAVSKLNKELGMKNPKVQIRIEARKALEDLGANPDLVMHGISQDSFGLGQVGELTGLPVPHFDLSRSLGMGNIIPGTEIPGMMLSGAKPGDVALEGFSQAAGASGNLVEDYYRGLFSTEPNGWKKGEKLLPLMSMRNVSKAMRYAQEGKERTANGVVIADFTPYDIRTGMEIFGQSLGFPLTKVQQGWEQELAKRDAVQFYKTWQSSIQRQMNIAYFQEDREAISDAMEAYRSYNASVPMPEMGIKPKSAKQAVKEYIKGQFKAEAGFSGDKKYIRLSKQVEEAFPDPRGDSLRNDVDPRP